METLQQLKGYKGSATGIVNLCIPPNTNVSDINTHLKNELGTANNIKSKYNRKAVCVALKSCSVFFKDIKTIPQTGIMVYSGHYV